jgi:hypothetical protein
MRKSRGASPKVKKIRAKKATTFLERLQNLPDGVQFEMHVWVDYLEMLCLIDNDNELSQADVQDRLRPRVDDLKEGSGDIVDSSVEVAGEKTDNWVSRVKEWFWQLEYRQKTFGDFYPFELTGNGTLLIKKSDLTQKQKFYISLLLSANLNYVGQKHHALTSSFEVISFEVMKCCLPKEAEVHIYGTSPLRPPHRYPGNLWAKIQKLASDIKEKVIALETDFAATNVGDGGLDIIGWLPCGDKNNSLLLIFGQSACTPDWIRKQATSSPEAWRRKLSFAASPYNMMFIPYCLRNADGTWHAAHTIQSILVDRQRIAHFLKEKLAFFKDLPSYGLVEEILTLKEGVV